MLVNIKHDIQILLLEDYSSAEFHLNAFLIYQIHFKRHSCQPNKI